MVTPSTIIWSLFILLAAGADAVYITVVRSKLVTNPSSLLLSMFLLLAIQAVSVFLGVIFSTRFAAEDSAEMHRHGYAARKSWFIFIALFMLGSFAFTVPYFPYISKAASTTPVQRVPVIAQQFTFLMPSHFSLDQRILFEVTSRDVNHNFGIYNSDGDLIAQVQAMPDYVNDLEVTFRKPGRYTVRCLEYCGTGHARMEKEFTVGGN